MMAGSSFSNPGYPSYVCATNIVTMKLSGRDTYDVWKTQMLCLLESYDMLHFIIPTENGVFGKQNAGEYYKSKLCRRSDAVVKGWILGSLSQQPLKLVVNLFKTNTNITSKDVWDKLNTIYGPPAFPLQDAAADLYEEEEGRGITSKRQIEETEKEKKQIKETEEEIIKEVGEEKREVTKEEEEEIRKEEERKRKKAEEEEIKRKKRKERAMEKLYRATLRQDFWNVKEILSQQVVTLRDKITINGNTALHVAVGTTKNSLFLKEMLSLATPPLDMRNSEGSTLLHVAAIVGNTQAAKLLVGTNPDLLFATDNEVQTPLARALSNMHTNTYLYLLQCNNVPGLDIEAGNNTSWGLLVNIISSKDYSSAKYFFDVNKHMPLTGIDTVLVAIAQNFPSKLNSWEKMFTDQSACFFTFLGYQFAPKFKFVEAIQKKQKDYYRAKHLIHELCVFIKSKTDSKFHHDYYNNAILEATRQNADEVVKIIVSEFPNAIWSTNEDGHNIIQYAVITRSEKVYNLLYQMSEHKNLYRTIKDPSGNNLLHLAARLAPPEKLNHISGAALQIQCELQWYKEVEGFVCPLNIMQKNWFEETPQMIFTREHKELVIEGEKWMKETAQSYTITAALITTIVFAAAITVPGGNKQDNGIPEFTSNAAFTVFAISDAISLFTSATSLLMFLSILTARFSEKDFIFKLPTKLMIGLTTLFISTTAMLVAFGATLFLMFCQSNPQILVPIVLLTCLPIACFVTLQFRIIKDLMGSTYGGSIFGKKSDRPFY